MNATGKHAGPRIRSAYLAVWAVFLALILYMDWSNARPYNLVVGLLAFPGTVIAALWTLRGGKWALGALTLSLAVLCGYLYWWSAEIGQRYATDPSPGLTRTMMVQVQIWTGITRVLIGRSEYLNAFCQLYWLALMPLLQLGFLPAIVRSMRRPMDHGALDVAG